MLTDLPPLRVSNRVIGALAGLGEVYPPRKLGPGLYEAGINAHHGFEENGIHYEQFPFSPDHLSDEEARAVFVAMSAGTVPSDYGVCDYPFQVLERYPLLEASPRRFVVCCDEMRKADQPPAGGWRWHKWGPYIGTKTPQYEYLVDEGPEIDSVWVYHIYELLES